MDPETKCNGNDFITPLLPTGPRLNIFKEKIELENVSIVGPPSIVAKTIGSPDGEYYLQVPISLTREKVSYMADYEYDDNGVIVAVHYDPVPDPDFGRPYT